MAGRADHVIPVLSTGDALTEHRGEEKSQLGVGGEWRAKIETEDILSLWCDFRERESKGSFGLFDLI